MQKMKYLIIALLCTMVQGAWADGVKYIERSWSGDNIGGSVVSTEKTCSSYTTWNGTSNLTGGWYYYKTSNKEINSHRITVSGNVNLILADGSYLKHKRGIYIQDGCTLTIYAQSGGTGKQECPSADGDNAAIGGNADAVGGHLVIHGGYIIAKADHNNAAGIGGGNHSSGLRSVTIYGGSVEAKGKDSGAGIGSGQQNDVYCNVTIYGGTVTATGGDYAAGIGGGYGGNGGTTEISGGTVNATGGMYAAGIGGGHSANGGTLTISGGTVTATAGYEAAGIGGGYGGHVGTVTIDGGTVYAKGGGDDGTAIGKGFHGSENSGTVNINGGHVEMTAVFNTYFVTGTLKLGDQFMVSKAGSKVGKDSREITCKSKNENTDDVTIVVKSCDHSGASINQKDDDHHTVSCSYCKVTEEENSFGSDDTCTKCGYEMPTITLTDGKDNGETLEAYDGETVNVEYDRELSAEEQTEATTRSSSMVNGQCSMFNGSARLTPSACLTR